MYNENHSQEANEVRRWQNCLTNVLIEHATERCSVRGFGDWWLRSSLSSLLYFMTPLSPCSEYMPCHLDPLGLPFLLDKQDQKSNDPVADDPMANDPLATGHTLTWGSVRQRQRANWFKTVSRLWVVTPSSQHQSRDEQLLLYLSTHKPRDVLSFCRVSDSFQLKTLVNLPLFTCHKGFCFRVL